MRPESKEARMGETPSLDNSSLKYFVLITKTKMLSRKRVKCPNRTSLVLIQSFSGSDPQALLCSGITWGP